VMLGQANSQQTEKRAMLPDEKEVLPQRHFGARAPGPSSAGWRCFSFWLAPAA